MSTVAPHHDSPAFRMAQEQAHSANVRRWQAAHYGSVGIERGHDIEPCIVISNPRWNADGTITYFGSDHKPRALQPGDSPRWKPETTT